MSVKKLSLVFMALVALLLSTPAVRADGLCSGRCDLDGNGCAYCPLSAFTSHICVVDGTCPYSYCIEYSCPSGLSAAHQTPDFMERSAEKSETGTFKVVQLPARR